VNDIESITSFLLGKEKIFLFGESSAASLIHQYVSLFGDNVRKFVTLDPIVVDLNSAIGYYRSFESFNNLFEKLENKNIYPKDAHVKISTFKNDILSKPYLNNDGDLDNLSLKIRLYELVFPYLQDSNFNVVDLKFELDVSSLIGKVNCPHFIFSGMNYDNLLRYTGKGVIISSVNSVTADHRVSQILAEYYQNCSMLLLNESNSLRCWGKIMI